MTEIGNNILDIFFTKLIVLFGLHNVPTNTNLTY